MKITDLMSKEAIKIHGHASSKMDAIDQMVSLMNKQGGTLTVAEPLILKNVDYNVIFLSNFLF